MISYRKRLLASTVTTIIGSVAMIAPQAASAACTVAAGVVTCATTTTTDTTNAGASPAVDRHYPVDTSAAVFTGTVSAGAVVDGFGLAFTNTVGGTNALNVVNNGAIQVNAALPAAVGGTAALDISAIGATPVNYSGTGTITNLSTGGSALSIDSTGTGNLTATIGGNVSNASAASFAIAVVSTGTAGNVAVTTATGTTIRSPGAGILGAVTNAASAGTVSITNNAAIASPVLPVLLPNTIQTAINGTTAGTGAVSIANTGAIGAVGDRSFFGIVGSITNATSAAALTVTGTGAIFSNNDAITAATAGTGPVVVNYTGAINTAAGDGIVATGTTGAMTITTGAITAVGGNGVLTTTTTGNQVINIGGAVSGTSFDGVNGTATTGNLTVNVTGGNVTGADDAIQLNSAGASIVNVSATRSLNGNFGVFSTGGGTLVVNNSGTINGAARAVLANTDATTVNNAIGATINGSFNLSNLVDTINNGGTLNGIAGTLLGDGNDAINNNANGIINLNGSIDFGIGTDSLLNAANGTINILGNSSLVGLESLTQNGRINLNNFVLTGSAFGFVNGANGFVDTSGSASLLGFTSITNNGTFDLAAGTLTVPAGVFANNGTLFADEGLTTITGQTSFTNAGTIDLQDGAVGDILTLASSYAGASGRLQVDTNNTTSDLLVVGAISGTTFVDVAGLGNGFINPLGVLVVDGTSSTAGAFLIGTQSGSPLINYDIRQSGADYFIISGPTAAAFQPLVLAAAASDIWYQSADEVIAQLRMPNELTGASVWGQVYGSKDKSGENDLQIVNGFAVDADNKTDNTRYGAQIGVDFGIGGVARIGLTGGLERVEVESAVDVELKGWNVGIYGQVGGALGFHGEAMFKHDRFDIDVDNGPFVGEESDGRSTGVDGAIGYRFPAGWVQSIDVNVGLSHVWTKLDGIGGFGFSYDYERFNSTRARAGVRANLGGKYRPYLDVTGYREFDGDTDIDLFDGVNTYTISRDGKGSYVRLEGGLGGTGGFGPMLAVWGDFGDRKGVGIRAGFRFGGATREEALPPPPPPEPERG